MDGDGIQELQVDADSELVSLVIRFAYTGRLEHLRFVDVERLLPLADRWNIVGLLQICTCFLQDRLNWDNCVGIWKFASIYFCTELESVARLFILYNMSALSIEGESTEFYGLSGQELEQ